MTSYSSGILLIHNVQHKTDSPCWHICETMYKFLATFYDSTVTLSGVYYPTAHMIVHHILEIATHLKAYENDVILLEAVAKMKLKYLNIEKKFLCCMHTLQLLGDR